MFERRCRKNVILQEDMVDMVSLPKVNGHFKMPSHLDNSCCV